MNLCGRASVHIVISDVIGNRIRRGIGGLQHTLELAAGCEGDGGSAGSVLIDLCACRNLGNSLIVFNLCLCSGNACESDAIRVIQHGSQNRIQRILVILIVDTVKFNRILGSNNGNADAVDGEALVLVACGFLHVTLYGKLVVGANCKMLFCSQCNCTDSPVDNIVERCVAVNAGNDNLVLQREIAIVDNTELIEIVSTAGLPKNLRA